MAVSEIERMHPMQADRVDPDRDRDGRSGDDPRRILELERRVRELEDAMRAREDILAVVTHDLRNPLGTIVMGATTLRQIGGAGDPRARIDSIAERIERQAERMARQINDLADLIEIQAGRLEIRRARHAPCEIVGAASERVGPIARERGVAFEARAPEGLPAVECDSERVVQVLSNLVASSVKVTARGGAIEVGARAEDRRVVFFVRDSGPGIARDDLAALFGPAWRRRQPGDRGGMGFAFARGVVDAHGGQIWAASEPSVGSTVYFSLSPSN
jgi:signal transduction histidine kinase